MIFGLAFEIGLAIVIFSFILEYMDSTLGMGYGTTLTPFLLLLGFEPLQIVPAVLLSQLIAGLLASFAHHSMGNVDFRPKTANIKKIFLAIKELGLFESFKRGIPIHLQVALSLAFFSGVGALIAVFVAISLPNFYLKLYIGISILIIGIIILATRNKNYEFSWKKIIGLGLIASFNKGLSGGGYGPVVVGGQLLSGVDGKNAIGITALAEGITCIVGVTLYLLTNGLIDWSLAPYLIVGAIFSVPLSALTVKKIKTHNLRAAIGILTLILGIVTLGKILS